MKTNSSTRELNLNGDQILRRMEMWCARHWVESRNAGMDALAAGDSRAYVRQRQDEKDWFGALLVVNRLNLGIEPLDGVAFLSTDALSGTDELLAICRGSTYKNPDDEVTA